MFRSIDALQEALRGKRYFASRGLATTMYLALQLQRPLFLEGDAGVGKTEVAKVLADLLDTELIRLQCYEGLDVHHAVYEWNYTRQMMHIRLLEARGDRATEAELFGRQDFQAHGGEGVRIVVRDTGCENRISAAPLSDVNESTPMTSAASGRSIITN